MRLIRKILKTMKHKRRSSSLLSIPPGSPPPEPKAIIELTQEKEKRKKKHTFKYDSVIPRVDTSPPRYTARALALRAPEWHARWKRRQTHNIHLLTLIRDLHYTRGRVDCHWSVPPKPLLFKFANRVNTLKNIMKENKLIYERIIAQGPKVETTASLRAQWARNREDILQRAQCAFVLFPPVPREDVEDPAFRAPSGLRRPRVYLTVQLEGHADLGELCVELFTDVCPNTCALFTELLAGDSVGHSYVGTHFFRKVSRLFWSGGDVTYDNGFGCYKQRGRRVPIGAENFHFSHSMPGLLSMSVTCDDEMCGIFNITFKPLPQFDLKNVVFGRIVRPSPVFDTMSELGAPLSPRPRVLIHGTRQRARGGGWLRGSPNTCIAHYTRRRKPASPIYSCHCVYGSSVK